MAIIPIEIFPTHFRKCKTASAVENLPCLQAVVIGGGGGLVTVIDAGLQLNHASIMMAAWHLCAGCVFPRSSRWVIHHRTEGKRGRKQSSSTRYLCRRRNPHLLLAGEQKEV